MGCYYIWNFQIECLTFTGNLLAWLQKNTNTIVTIILKKKNWFLNYTHLLPLHVDLFIKLNRTTTAIAAF